MSNKAYEVLISELANKIKENGNKEITGPILNTFLQDFLDSVTLKHIVADAAERNAIVTKYPGMRVYVTGEDETYTLQADGTTWSVGSGDAYTKAEMDAFLAAKVNTVFGKELSANDFTNALLSKLDSIETGATANSLDGDLLDRANHTGTQAASTITGLEEALLENRIVVTQANAATALGGTIDSTKEYFLDGIIDLGTTQITVPAAGMTIKGYGFDLSGLISSENNYTMFISQSVGGDGFGSGNLLGSDYYVSVTGTTSKVYALYDDTGFNAFEFIRVNYIDCTSLGDLYNYRQGLESGTGRFGGSPSLTLHGTWLGGYRITTSLVRSLSGAMTEPLFKEGTSFQMNSRFLTDINIDLPALAAFMDFQPSNFPNPSTIQFRGAEITRGGVYDADDTNIVPNLAAGDIPCDWKGNNGLPNTYVGGNSTVDSEATTVITVVSTWETMNALTWTDLDLQHFDSPAPGQLRHLGSTPREFEVSAQVVLESTANNSVSIKFRKWDDSDSAFVELEYTTQTRVVNNLQGGRDVAYFNILTAVTLDKNDYLYLQARNNTGTSNITAELSSFFRIQER